MKDVLKARLLLKCQRPTSPKQVWRQFQGDYSYNWIRQKLDELYEFGLLAKRKGGNKKARNKVFYTTKDDEDIEWAKNYLKGED